MTQTVSKPAVKLALIAVLLGLWACGAPAPKPDQPTEIPPPEFSTERIEEQSLSLPESPYASEFDRARYHLQQFDWLSASQITQALSLAPMDSTEQAHLTYLRARIAFTRGDLDTALSLLNQVQWPPVHPGIRYRALGLQRDILDLRGDHVQAAASAQRLLLLAPEGELPALRQGLWRNLQRMDTPALENAHLETRDSPWRDWLSLAILSRGPATAQELQRWLEAHPEHPAAAHLPAELAVKLAPGNPPARVALLLPLSGRLAPAGKAVRDGYLASYYAARRRGEANFELHIYNQDYFPSANAAYDAAVAEGMELLIGPLGKRSVAQLQQREFMPLPVIALNRSNSGATANREFMQHALAPEDEARRIAETAFGQGTRRALLVAPRGAWGDKVSMALTTRWQQLGGSLAGKASFSGRDEYSSAIELGLGIPDSQARARRVRDIFQTTMEFTPRRREDIDVVFLLARNGAEARSLKPLLAFHYAGDIPIYSTSSAYSGVVDKRDRDLNGIKLVEIPWLLDSDNELRAAIEKGATASSSYVRLNALGADAFLLQSHHLALQNDNSPILHGSTGLLSIRENGWIERELPLATFDRGVIRRH